MAQSIPTREPASVVAGDTVAWTITLADYPASDGWVLKYRLINAAGKIDITSAASGDDHAVSVAAATSALWVSGTYAWQAYVEKALERYTTGSGSIVVQPNLAAQATSYDTRSAAATALDNINIWLTTRDPAVADYEIANRRMRFHPIPDLLKMRDKLKAEVAAEAAAANMAAGLGGRGKIYVRYGK